VGPVTFKKLLEQFSEPEAVFANISSAHGGSDKVKNNLSEADWATVEDDLVWLSQPDRHAITLHDPRYPVLLKNIADPPSILFVHGDPDLLSQWQIALVTIPDNEDHVR